MKLLSEISDKDRNKNMPKMNVRKAARAVLFDNNLIPLLFVSRYNYHKLPGGGIKKHESKINALKRESMEEVGCKIDALQELGKIIEYRSQFNLKQTSFCYSGNIISKGQPNFTKKELSDGFKIIWVTLNKAISILASDEPANYEGSFIQKRDLIILKEVKKTLQF
ncbi:MAG: NUDIX domain-containing protein [Candidatus Magasanikbacteria bacterium]|jgi:8-oxo-dGTP pyrophosphatase MutT (NUDIX family)